MSARVIQVIVSSEGRKGTGTEENPMKVVYSVHTMDGQLLFRAAADEVDPEINHALLVASGEYR